MGKWHGFANKQLEALIPLDPTFVRSPFAAKQLQLAQNMFNSRMAGAPELERNIFTSGANFQGQVNRNATAASQALALAAAGQGQTDQSLSDLQTREEQNKYSLLDNLNNAYKTNADQDYQSYLDQARRYEDLVKIRGAQVANRQNTWKNIIGGVQALGSIAATAFGGGFTGAAKGVGAVAGSPTG